jgi:hypothetical protein
LCSHHAEIGDPQHDCDKDWRREGEFDEGGPVAAEKASGGSPDGPFRVPLFVSHW